MEENKKRKVAILFWGITRSLQYTIDSIQRNLFDVFENNNFEICKFIHTFILEKRLYSNKRANEFNIQLDPEEYKLLRPDYAEVENQDVVASKLALHKYRKMGNPWSGSDFQTLDNLVLSCYSRYRATKMLEKSGKHFDYVVYIRPDVMCINKFPIHNLEFLDKHPHSCLLANFHRFGPWKINDRMYVSKFKNCKYYGKVFKNMYKDSLIMVLHSETYIGYIINKNNIKVRNINFYFNRVRANGAIEKDYPIHSK
jgi:hypothetical protein